MQVEGSGDHRRRGVPGPYPSAAKYPAQNERFGIHGIFEGKEQSDDFPEIWEHEICVPKPRILV